LRLQDLNPDVKTLLAMRDIEMGHARALLAIDGMEQSRVAKDVARKGLSVRETEALIRKISAPAKKPKVIRKDPDIIKLEERLTEYLGAQVHIKQKGQGKGAVEIAYSSLDVLEGILSKIES
jgi:ParB family chromosome partitioning protein